MDSNAHPTAAAALPRSAVWFFADADAYPQPFVGALAGADYSVTSFVSRLPLTRALAGARANEPGRDHDENRRTPRKRERRTTNRSATLGRRRASPI